MADSKNVKAFYSHLESGKFYDILNKKEKNLLRDPVPFKGCAGVYKGGGQREDEMTCAAHAAKGCIIEILDSFDLDCDEEDIQQQLEDRIPNARINKEGVEVKEKIPVYVPQLFQPDKKTKGKERNASMKITFWGSKILKFYCFDTSKTRPI